MRTIAAALLIACTALGCRIVVGAKTNPAARSALGASAVLKLDGRPGELHGELLAVNEAGLFVHDSTAVWFVPFQTISHGTFEWSGVTLSGGHAPKSSDAEQLRLLSRFPQGVNADLQQRLLAAYGQTALAIAGQ